MLERNSFVILSAELASYNQKAKDMSTRALAGWLRSYGYCHKPVIGVYKGTKEQSFVVPVECQEDVDKLATIATNLLLQESILYVNGLTKEATLLFANAKPMPIGKWQPANDIVGLDGYTIDNDNVYTCA